MSEPGHHRSGGREPRQFAWIWLVYLLLFAVAIPWYWPVGFRGPLVAGLPTWVAVTIAAVFLLAVWSGCVIRFFWDDHFDPGNLDGQTGGGGES